MSVRPLTLWPAPGLSKPCSSVRLNDPSLQPLIRDLTETLYHSPGVGLAAPQIGVSKRVSVIDVKRGKQKSLAAQSSEFLCLINPTLLSWSGKQTPREGCLSVPDWLANVRRYKKVVARTETLEGEERIIRAEGFFALAIQHEIDHLDGKLFLDRISNLKTDVFRRKTY